MKKRTGEILQILDDMYGTEISTFLHAENAGQLLIATMLSAQCTDARVNLVTKDLFVKYPDMQAFADADLKELEEDIRSTGFYHNKAKNIIGCAKMLCEKYGGEVPHTVEELTELPGVGRKTANVVRGNIFHDPSIVVDTHVKRIAYRLKLTEETDPVKVEFDLMKVLPRDHWILINLHLITFGRETCLARNPKCEVCRLQSYCREYRQRMKEKEKKTNAKK
ncbi:MAG: endonuclease III [Eubacteriales bacterium]|nr:endonuclease III [Eubacteriales bacterium]